MSKSFLKILAAAFKIICFVLIFLSLSIGEELGRPKIGLVLSGGGAMGFAHIGTLKLIDSLQIPIDYITGTSMGGIAAALYAVGYSGKEIEEIALQVDWQKAFTDRPLRSKLPYFQKRDAEKYQVELGVKDFLPLGPGGAIVGQNINLLFARLVFNYLQVTDFDSLPIPFRCLAVDLITGKEVVLSSGSLAKAMRATMAVPSVFSPVEWGDSLLIDGGLLNNLPVNVVRQMGAEIVIAAAVGNPYKNRTEIRNTLDVLTQSFNVLRDNTMQANAADADILIDCMLIGLGPADFGSSKVEKIIGFGDQAARRKIGELQELKNRYYLSDPVAQQQIKIPDNRLRIAEITIAGNRTMSESAIRELIHLNENDYCNREELEHSLDKLRATNDFLWVRYTTERIGDNAVRLNINVNEKWRPLIYGVDIEGNTRLSFDFIYRLLGIRPGDIFLESEIEERITYLYSLGFFDEVSYGIKPLSANYARFTLYVRESAPYKIRLGLQYNDYRKLIAAINLLILNKPLTGLRIENEVQFIGLNRLRIQAYYPSRLKDFPLYPYANFTYHDIPFYLYDKGGRKVASYLDRAARAGTGIGLLYQNYWNIEVGITSEFAKIYPDVASNDPIVFPSWKNEILSWNLTTNIDLLDDTFIPRQGLLWHAEFNQCPQVVGDTSAYYQLMTSLDYYLTAGHKHTIHGYGYYGYVNMPGITNRFLYQGGPENYVGVEYNQLMATHLALLRLDYRLELLKNLYLTLIGNTVLRYENNILMPGEKPGLMLGYGAGVTFVSPLGPFECYLCRGDKSVYQPGEKRLIAYFRAGYVF